ncbi:MAG TPA: hypothetical protein VEC99_01660, partial [Clostridia bacterium]|nr:hypothetical protein [Clostridia bacterium]
MRPKWILNRGSALVLATTLGWNGTGAAKDAHWAANAPLTHPPLYSSNALEPRSLPLPSPDGALTLDWAV